jgi:hypothetical protein
MLSCGCAPLGLSKRDQENEFFEPSSGFLTKLQCAAGWLLVYNTFILKLYYTIIQPAAHCNFVSNTCEEINTPAAFL